MRSTSRARRASRVRRPTERSVEKTGSRGRWSSTSSTPAVALTGLVMAWAAFGWTSVTAALAGTQGGDVARARLSRLLVLSRVLMRARRAAGAGGPRRGPDSAAGAGPALHAPWTNRSPPTDGRGIDVSSPAALAEGPRHAGEPGVQARLDRFYRGRKIVAITFLPGRPQLRGPQGSKVDPGEVQLDVVQGMQRQGNTSQRRANRTGFRAAASWPGGATGSLQRACATPSERVVIKGRTSSTRSAALPPERDTAGPGSGPALAARFKARDAFFGFPLGSAVAWRFRTASTSGTSWGTGAGTAIAAARRRTGRRRRPRISSRGPVALSRNQEVELG